MSNLFGQFKRLFPDAPLLAGEVTQYADGYATVLLPGGGILRARGSAQVGDNVFVRDDVIEGPAPLLSNSVIEI